MRLCAKYLFSVCMASGVLAMLPSLSVRAAVNAGITANLGLSLMSNTAVYSSDFRALAQAADRENHTICGYFNLGIADVENHLNVREGAGAEYDLVGKMPVNAGCEILGTEGEWTKIQSGKVTGYVKSEFLLTGEAAAERARAEKRMVATSNTGGARLRAQPNTDSPIWAVLSEGEEITMLEDLGDWVKVVLDNDECYVYRELVEISETLPKAMTMTEVRYGQGVSDVRVSLVDYALQFVGNRYVWGGTSLTNGADCSGYTLRIFERFGIYLPHYSGSQAQYGRSVSASEAKPGDLFFYSMGGRIGHVAIYIGNGQIVHAMDERSGIRISSAYYMKPVKVISLLD